LFCKIEIEKTMATGPDVSAEELELHYVLGDDEVSTMLDATGRMTRDL
jgi:hypothetical protein